MLLASLTDEKEPQRANSRSFSLHSYEEVNMGSVITIDWFEWWGSGGGYHYNLKEKD